MILRLEITMLIVEIILTLTFNVLILNMLIMKLEISEEMLVNWTDLLNDYQEEESDG